MSDTAIAGFLAECIYDPLKYVMGAFPWATDKSIQVIPLAGPGPEGQKYRDRFPGIQFGPDLWQCEFLDELGQQLQDRGFDGRTPVLPARFATVTGHETGKSTLAAWLVKFIMDTRPFSIGSVTANTDEQLRTKTWAELGKWHRMSITAHWFDYAASRSSMSLTHKDKNYKDRWKCHAKTCDPSRSEAFAGQHAPTATSFYIFDEASRIADKLFEVREGGLSSGEPMVFDFGNGTRNTGAFFENCVGRFARRNTVRSIDSRDTYLTNKEKIQDDLDTYGEDSDFFRTRWRGLFPQHASTQFISSDAVAEAQTRLIRINHDRDPLIIGVDVARFGDDESVIYPRIGMDARSYAPIRFKGADTTIVSNAVAECIAGFRQIGKHCAAVFVDGGGGYGGGVVDQLRNNLNIAAQEIQPGGAAIKIKNYQLRVDEMWGEMRDAMPRLALPEPGSDLGQELFEQLTQREYGVTIREQVRLETKRSMKKRGVGSPDVADALALTFARPVQGDYDAGGSPATFIKLPEADPYD